MVERLSFRFPIAEQPESPNAALYHQLRTSLSGPAPEAPQDYRGTQPEMQLAQYSPDGRPNLGAWFLWGLQGNGREAPAPDRGGDQECRARHLPSNDCYDFKRLSPREQEEYDDLKSNRDRDDYLYNHRR